LGGIINRRYPSADLNGYNIGTSAVVIYAVPLDFSSIDGSTVWLCCTGTLVDFGGSMIFVVSVRMLKNEERLMI